ncbi:hypothetical protein [Plantibacter sp. ME-Dv--P-122b]|uniref:hypothetical protein n=1 Tax=Plantibacter sp. ME-Dv--P-122b TaxID=3040300 RepID=UPI00254FA609|nr:hypothetical protein [Plantibacter sp. ME-Dv--P-122b]
MGSTSYKQAKPGWQKIFLSFYREFPQFLVEADRRRSAIDGLETGFSLWKAVGDELIFEVDVKTELAVGRAVRVWLDAISFYERDVLSDVSLALKGGAFIATFPGPDSESTIPRQPTIEQSADSVVRLNDKALSGTRTPSKYLYDYFGPSIDTGFRVYSLSTQRNFTLSIEVAWAMAVSAHGEAADPDNPRLHAVDDFAFLGGHFLKGVWGGRDYPVFAIDRHYHDPVNKAMASLRSSGFDSSKVIAICDACSKDADWPFRMYLPDSAHAAFTVVPLDAMEELRHSEGNLDSIETAQYDEPGIVDPAPPLE